MGQLALSRDARDLFPSGLEWLFVQYCATVCALPPPALQVLTPNAGRHPGTAMGKAAKLSDLLPHPLTSGWEK